MTEGRSGNDHYSLIRSKDVREWMRETTPLHTEEKRTLIHYAYLPLEEKIQWTERLLQETEGEEERRILETQGKLYRAVLDGIYKPKCRALYLFF